MVSKIIVGLSWLFVLGLFLNQGCQDPIIVGSDLLENEKLVIAFNDSLKLSSKTIAAEPIITHRPPIIGGDQFDYRTYLLGQLNDNIFGKIGAELYVKFQFSSSAAPTYQNDKANILFDSLIHSTYN